MLSALPWLVAALTAIAVATGIFWILRLLSGGVDRVVQLRQSDETIPAALPFWIRAPVAAVEPTAAWLGPHIPISIRGRVQEQLKRAGIEEELTPPQFLSLAAVSALVVGAAASLLQFSLSVVLLGLVTGFGLPWLWLRDIIESRRDEVTRELPLYVDMLTLALEAGGSLSVALRVATERSPDSVLRRAFIRVQGDLRAGRSRAEALRALGERLDMPAISPLVAALVQADASGGSLASVLRAQSEQRLNERFARAEKRAMEAPVRMLGPLVLCIFPCTFLILGFPIVMRFLQA
ncbi:MAG: type II secretion system F family protein [Gammaproteobacteria bacterium]|jgi:tight adherence protein C|nr:type II secretion system F family protein [Gammaproteobacteria bacterium]NDF86620.1 type II secretion system F family protein [Gammaproteobacteria bacterium]